MKYRKGIFLHNFLIPAIIVCLILVTVFVVKSKVDLMYADRIQAYSQTKQLEKKVKQLQGETEDYSKFYSAPWSELMQGEVSAQVTKTVNGILEEIPSKDLQQIEFMAKEQKGKFAAGINQKSSSVELGFRGKYSVMQSVVAELETRLPHFLLESLKVTPSKSGEGKLDFNLNYVVWQK